MTARQRSVFQSLRGVAPALGVFATLGGLYYWGHHYHWSIPLGGARQRPAGVGAARPGESPQAAHSFNSSSVKNGTDAGAAGRLEFHSPEALRKAGLRVESAKELDMTDYVTAPGAVNY